MPTTGKGPAANLAARRAAGQVHSDPVQEKVVGRLQAVHDRLLAVQKQPAKPGFWARLGLGGADKPAEGPRGLYIWGPVGRGKSMLMDLFFADAPVARKRRVHFHEFMLEVHDRLHRRREELAAKGAPPESDTIVPIAKAIAQETRLLCFDEFQVTNIADAMILGRLFETLFEEGITVIATSNRAPDDLYSNGLQRDRFLPFIELVKQRLEILELGGGHDYRMDRMRELDMYLTPLGAWATKKLDEAFRALADGADGEPRVLRTQGRDVDVPRAAPGVAMAHYLEAHGGGGLPVHRRALPQRHPGRDPENGIGQSRQGGALRDHDRHVLREESEVHLFGRSFAGKALHRRRRCLRVPAHGIAPDGDAKPGISGFGACRLIILACGPFFWLL